ncbi:hypothetical protein K438DRAFT_1662197, partial [Mycena galopus ATCC 62051]
MWTIVCDEFDEKMTDDEVNSFCEDLAKIYHERRRTENTFTLVFTWLKGKTLARLDSHGVSYKRWTSKRCDGRDHGSPCDGQPLHYLMADTEDELSTLKPNDTYLIGGICDYGPLQNEFLEQARASGILTWHLPIATYLSKVPEYSIAVVNRHVQALLHWGDTRPHSDGISENKNSRNGKPAPRR